MNFDDDADPWGSTTSPTRPPKSQLRQKAPITTSTNHSNSIDNDNAAWDATDDDGDSDKEEEFVEATSRLNLSLGSLRDSGNDALDGLSPTTTKSQPTTAAEDTFDDFEEEDTPSQAIEAPPIAGPSSFNPTKDTTFDSAQTQMDDFGDFGDDSTPANGDEDDDDFGAFDDAGGADDADFSFGDEDDFNATAIPEAQPEASTSSSQPIDRTVPRFNEYFQTRTTQPVPPDFELALANAPAGTSTLSTISSVLDQFYAEAFPDLFGSESTAFPNPPENSIQARYLNRNLSVKDRIMPEDGTEQDKENRRFYERMMEEPVDLAKMMGKNPGPNGEPWRWDWKKSKTRLMAMRQLGLPVNLDDFADPPAQPMAPLVLPSIRTTSASPSRSSATNGNGRSSISRSSSPSSPSKKASSRPGNSVQPLPLIDIAKCKELVAMKEEEMSLKTVAQLNNFRDELQDTAVQASNHLTGLLERKEVLSGQNATYNAMIQDLVMTAQKIRSSSSPSTSAMRKPSLKRSNSNTKPSPGIGLGTGSKPPSRPASPAPKSALSRSTAGQSVEAGKPQVRKSSLW